jgi:hypothetical protein
MTAPFRFSMEAKLEALREERDACERAAQRAQVELEQAKAGEARYQAEAARFLERIDALRHEARGRTGVAEAMDLVRDESRRLVVERQLAEARSQVSRAAERVAFCQGVVALRKQDLEAVWVRVRAMETLREMQQREFDAENQKRAEAEQDDASLRAWQARQRNEQAHRDRP